MSKNDFNADFIPLNLLKKRAFNLRWAAVGTDVIPLTAADPDFPVALPIRQALIDYSRDGVFSYGPAEGLPDFRAVCAKVFANRRKIATCPQQILAVDSAAAGMWHIARFALSPGDEVIIFDPVDFLFKKTVEAVGGKVTLLPIDSKTQRINVGLLRSLITKKTRMLAICNPINPSGQILTRKELTIIGEIALEFNLWILNDEIWSEIIYPPNVFTSILSINAEIAAKTITVHGFSKTFALAGLRVGYIVAPNEEVFDKLLAASLASSTITGVATLSQIAAIAAYQDGWPWFDGFLKHLTAQRDYATEKLEQIPSFKIQKPEATYLLFPKVNWHGKSSECITEKILTEARVALVPGSSKWFGPGAKKHVRLAFATSREILAEALVRIGKIFNKS